MNMGRCDISSREGILFPTQKKRGLTTFSCLVSSPKIVTRYLLSALICQAHLTINLYVTLWLLLVDSDQAWILWHTSWERVETETLLGGNLICKEYFYIIRRWETWMAGLFFFYTCLISTHDTLKWHFEAWC